MRTPAVARVASVSSRARSARSPEPGRVVLVDQRVEEGPGRRGSTPPHVSACLRARDGLAARRRRRPRPRPRRAPASMLDEPLRHERHAFGDDLPVVGGVAGHEVERHAHGLHRAAEHAEVAQPLAGVVLGRARARAVRACTSAAMRSASVSAASAASSARSVVAVELGAFGGAVGGEVGHLVVVAGDALTGGGERVERGEPLDVVLGEVVDGRAHDVRAPVRRGLGSHDRVGRAACRTSGSGVETSTPETTGSTTFDGCASDREIVTVRVAGNAANAHDGRLPPGGCTTIRIREPARNAWANG